MHVAYRLVGGVRGGAPAGQSFLARRYITQDRINVVKRRGRKSRKQSEQGSGEADGQSGPVQRMSVEGGASAAGAKFDERELQAADLEKDFASPAASRVEREDRNGVLNIPYTNRRRAARMELYLKQKPRVPGGDVPSWVGDTNSHWFGNALHEVTQEEVEEYVEGTEYAELPEVVGKTGEWPKAPFDTTPVNHEDAQPGEEAVLVEQVQRHHFEEGAAMRALTGGASHALPSWLQGVDDFDAPADVAKRRGHGPYDYDLTTGKGREEYEADMYEEQEYAMAPVPIRGAVGSGVGYQAIRHMKWHNGRWVAHDAPVPKPAVHDGMRDPFVDTKVIDPDLELGPHGDGGFSSYLSEFAAEASVGAGAEGVAAEVFDDETPDPRPHPPESEKAAETTRSTPLVSADGREVEGEGEEGGVRAVRASDLPESDKERLRRIALREMRHGDPEATVEEPTVQHGWIHTKEWETVDFFGAGATKRESGDRLVNGVPVDALAPNTVVTEDMVNEEHEHRVFSGLYPRAPGESMTPFERKRLAACLLQHQKQGVPLTYPGVDPYSTFAFMRLKIPHNIRKDDRDGRKHDLSVEYRLRQKLKLGYDAAEATRINVRIPYEEWDDKWWVGELKQEQQSFELRTSEADLLPASHNPDGFLVGEGYKVYGENKYVGMMDYRQPLGRIQPNRRFTRGTSFTMSDQEWVAKREAELLQREIEYEQRREEQRRAKEKAYRVRMGMDPPETEEGKAEGKETAIRLECLRSGAPDPEEVELQRMLQEDDDYRTYEVPMKLQSLKDTHSVWGRNPWAWSTRYLPWAAKVHWRDIPQENFQLRGTGYKSLRTNIIYNPNGRLRRNDLENIGFHTFAAPDRKKFWDNLNNVVSKDSVLDKLVKGDQSVLPPSGPSRECINDLYVGAKAPDWAFPPRQNTQTKTVEAYDWNSDNNDLDGKPVYEEPEHENLVPIDDQYTVVHWELPSDTSGDKTVRTSSTATRVVGEQRRGYHICARRAYHSQPREFPDYPPQQRLSHRHQWPVDVSPDWPFNGTSGVVLGLDGTVHRGGVILPGVSSAVNALMSSRIPLVFYSDGYDGRSEETIAAQLTQAMGVKIPADNVVLGAESIIKGCLTAPVTSDSAIRALSQQRVLVVGARGCGSALRGCGLKGAVEVGQVVSRYPDTAPSTWRSFRPPTDLPREVRDGDKPDTAFAAILIVGEPEDWYQSLQLCVDALIGRQGTVGCRKSVRTLNEPLQGCPVYVVDTRMVYAGTHPVPRLGTGGFLSALQGVYRDISSRTLTWSPLGRPNPAVFRYLEEHLRDISVSYGFNAEAMTHIYNVSDNIDHDVAAAGRFRDGGGEAWWSIVVGGGVSSDGMTTIGRIHREQFLEAKSEETLSIPEAGDLRKFLEQRRADVGYHNLAMFVADLLQMEYHSDGRGEGIPSL